MKQAIPIFHFKFLIAPFLIYYFSIAKGATESETYQTIIRERQAAKSAWESPGELGLSEEELQENNQSHLADSLRKRPGLTILQQGGGGQYTSLSIRGSRSQDVLVLVNGIVANDTISPSGSYDFSELNQFGVKRVSIRSGSQSVLYGSGATAGVVLVDSFNGNFKPELKYLAELGSPQSFRVGIQHQQNTQLFESAFFVQASESRGISSAEAYPLETSAANSLEKDSARSLTSGLNLRWHKSQNTSFSSSLRLRESAVDLDNSGGVSGDDPNNTSNSRIGVLSFHWDQFFMESHKASLQLGLQKNQRQDANPISASNSLESSGKFESEQQQLRWEQETSFGDTHRLIWGPEWRKSQAASTSRLGTFQTDFANQKQEELAFFTEWQKNWDGLTTNLGGRAQSLGAGKQLQVFSFEISKVWSPEWKGHLRTGNGFKAPTLYQLYSAYGNTRLEVEKSTSQEAVLEFLGSGEAQKDSVAVTLFRTQFEQLIEFDLLANKYENILKARTEGLDLRWLRQWNQQYSTEIAAASTTALTDQRIQLLRRPNRSGYLALTKKRNQSEWSIKATFTGSREDLDPNTFERITLRPHSLLGLQYALHWPAANTTAGLGQKFYLRLENLLGEKYQEIAGYGAGAGQGGVSAFIGVTGSLELISSLGSK